MKIITYTLPQQQIIEICTISYQYRWYQSFCPARIMQIPLLSHMLRCWARCWWNFLIRDGYILSMFAIIPKNCWRCWSRR